MPPLSASDLEAVSAAVDTHESRLSGLYSLSSNARGRLPRLDDKTEAFCREPLAELSWNRRSLPPEVDVDGALSALHTLDALRPIKAWLRRLAALGDALDGQGSAR